MVKKVGGKKPGRTGATTPVQPTKTVESAKIGKVDRVKGAEKQQGAGKVAAGGHEITPEMKEQIMQMIDEEADKIFGGEQGLSKAKKDTLKGAVKMAIEAGIISEDEERQ